MMTYKCEVLPGHVDGHKKRLFSSSRPSTRLSWAVPTGSIISHTPLINPPPRVRVIHERVWSPGRVDVTVVASSRGLSARVPAALKSATQTPRIEPARAPASGPSISCALHMNPTPLQPRAAPLACSQRQSLDESCVPRAGACEATEAQVSRHCVPPTCWLVNWAAQLS